MIGNEAPLVLRRIRDLAEFMALPEVWLSGEPADIANRVAEALRELLAADLVYVRVRDVAPETWHEAISTAEFASSAPPTAAVRAVLAPQLRSPLRDVVHIAEIPPANQTLRLIVCPIGRAAEQGLAAIGAARSDFPEVTEQLLSRIALNQAAIAVQRANVEQALRAANRELRARSERESAIQRIALAVRSTLELDEIQRVATRSLGEALTADRSYFSHVDIDRRVLHIEQDYCRDDLPTLAGRRSIPDDDGRPADYHAGRNTLVIDDLRQWPFPEPITIAVAAPTRSVISVPLFDAGRLVATLTVTMSDQPRIWSADEVLLAEQVAAIIRSSVESARATQRERTIATQLQAALQPAVPAETDGLELADYYKSALGEAEVGGDFHDVFSVDGGTTYLVVGDVSGKGLAAARQVATIRNMLRFAICNQTDLPLAVGALNHMLEKHHLLLGFATLFVGRFDARRRSLTYVNCGQEPGLVRRASSGIVDELAPTGPVIGSFPGAAYGDRTVALGVGDAIALFTDGLTEAGPSRSRLFGVEGMAELLRADAQATGARSLAARLIAGVEAFADGGMRDDRCLLVAIVTGEPPPSQDPPGGRRDT